jgi:alpha-amylase
MLAILVFHVLCLLHVASAATPAEWRTRIVYQVMTDRFALTDNSTTAPCNTAEQVYCGGTWQGIINKLDYIQDMGFTAVGNLTLKKKKRNDAKSV